MISISVSAITVVSVSTTAASIVVIAPALGGRGSIARAGAVWTRSATAWAVVSGGSRRRSTTATTAPFVFSLTAATLIFSVTPVSIVPISLVISVAMMTTVMMIIVPSFIISATVRWPVFVAWAISSNLSWLGRIFDRRFRLGSTMTILGSTAKFIFVFLHVRFPIVALGRAAVPIVATPIATVMTPATLGFSFVVLTATVAAATILNAAITIPIPGAAVSISVSVLAAAPIFFLAGSVATVSTAPLVPRTLPVRTVPLPIVVSPVAVVSGLGSISAAGRCSGGGSCGRLLLFALAVPPLGLLGGLLLGGLGGPPFVGGPLGRFLHSLIVGGIVGVLFVLPALLGGLAGLLRHGLGLPPALLGLEFMEVARSVVGIAKINGTELGGIVGGTGFRSEVSIRQSRLGRRALLGIELQQLLHEVELGFLHPALVLLPELPLLRFVDGNLPGADELEVAESLPVLLGRRPDHVEDEAELLHLRLAREEGPAQDELGQDAARRPDVHGAAVARFAEQELRGTVPEGDDLVG